MMMMMMMRTQTCWNHRASTRSQQRAQVILQPGFEATAPLGIVGLMEGVKAAAHHQEVGLHIKECNCHVACHAILRPLPP